MMGRRDHSNIRHLSGIAIVIVGVVGIIVVSLQLPLPNEFSC
jgi:preprotein translocase subunit Sss1